MWLIARGQNIDINMSLEEVDYNLHEESKTAVEEVTADAAETARELESEVEPRYNWIAATLWQNLNRQ